MNVEGMTHRATLLGMADIEAREFVSEIIEQVAHTDRVSDAFFVFECVRWQGNEIKKLKDEIACMKQEKSS